jgi:hypothetical protein
MCSLTGEDRRLLNVDDPSEGLMTQLLKRPSALVPFAMLAAALATVVDYAVMFGTARQADEGAAAHIWQLLMVGQLPVAVFFAVKWLASAPKLALGVLALQTGAARAAVLPVWWYHW